MDIFDMILLLLVGIQNMWLDLQKVSLLANFVFQEMPIWSTEATVVLLCYIVATPDLLYTRSGLIASVS